MKMFKKMKKGFTLVELIIVMVILGALAAIAIPKMGGSTDGALLASVKSDLRTATVKANEFYSKNLTYTDASATALGLVPSPGNSITVTPTNSGASFTVSVTRTGEATCAAASLFYDSSDGKYSTTSGGTKTADIPKLTCTAAAGNGGNTQ